MVCMDQFSSEKRSEIMSRIRSKNTAPEISIRHILHKMGLRYRLHVKNLPGKPDLFFKKYNAIVFYNGCFWHGHTCKHSHIPKTNSEYWYNKISKNIIRDKANIQKLLDLNFRVLVIWGCSHRGKGKAVEFNIAKKAYEWIKSNEKYKEIPSS